MIGLYVSTSDVVKSAVIYLERKFGQWQEDGKNQDSLEFYEYVEALQITGDRMIPAGEVSTCYLVLFNPYLKVTL